MERFFKRKSSSVSSDNVGSSRTASSRQNESDDVLANLQADPGLRIRMIEYDYLLITLALVLPVATASVERAFSVMNIIKGPLRNKMGDQWLSDSLLVYVEKDVFDCIENEAIMLRFQNMKPRRGQL
ncbi:hypothetical protein ACE6H2_001637 [Prunus campanulata]